MLADERKKEGNYRHNPKKMHLTTVTDEEIKLVMKKLKERPRENPYFLSPSEVFYNYFVKNLHLVV
jgi:IS30 family transposase